MRHRAGLGVLGIVLLALAVMARAATGVLSASPWWFEDDYTSRAYVTGVGTTAAVHTAGPGTVTLPALPAALAFDPAAAVGVIASADGIRAWAFDGDAMVRAPQFDLAGSGYVGAAWIGRAGSQLAAATAGAVTLAAWSGTGWARVGTLALSGIRAVAEGAPSADSPARILVGTASGFEVVSYRGGTLALDAGAGVSDIADAGGIAAAPGGGLVAVWHGRAVSVYGWDGQRYRETPTWEVPPGSQPVLGVAWFRNGNGYWILTGDGALTAYGFDGSFAVRIPALCTTLALPVAALAAGWRQGDVAALVAGGWLYEDGSPLQPDPARSVSGVRVPMYASPAQLESTVLHPGHAVDELQVDASLDLLPPGTAVTYSISTDGGGTWTSVPPCINPTDPLVQCAADNTPVPSGSAVVYRMTLSTADPSVTPVVGATDLFEIATEVQAVGGARAVLIR